jgi:hypothetical protein
MADESIVPRVSLIFSLLALAGSSMAVAVSWRAQRRTSSMPPAMAAAADGDDIEWRVTALERQIALLRVGVAARTADSAKGAPMAGDGCRDHPGGRGGGSGPAIGPARGA